MYLALHTPELCIIYYSHLALNVATQIGVHENIYIYKERMYVCERESDREIKAVIIILE